MVYGGVMVSQSFPTSRNHPGETLRASRYVLEKLGAAQMQTVDILEDSERRAFGDMVREKNACVTYCIARMVNERKLFLGDLNPEKRRAAIEAVKAQFACALEAGAQAMTLVSGPRPESEEDRQEALRLLALSLTEVAAHGAKVAPGISLRIEPLDYFAHKRNVLGSTQESIALCQAVAAGGQRLSLCFDTAHALLSGEDVASSIALAGEWIEELHLCNACTDASHPLYGDHHIAPGAPGSLDIPQYRQFIQLAERHCPNAHVFTEYLCPADLPGEAMANKHVEILQASGVTIRRC